MVFHTLNIVVPLFEWHFGLTWHGFATESVYSQGTQVQFQCQSIDQVPQVWIRLSRNWGLRRWSLRSPSSNWSCRGGRWAWLSQGNPPSPSWKGDLHSSSLGFLLPDGCPQGVVGDFWGCIQFTECNLLAEILHKLTQCVVSKVTKLCLEVMQSFPTWVWIISGWMGFPPLRVEIGVLKGPLPLLSYMLWCGFLKGP